MPNGVVGTFQRAVDTVRTFANFANISARLAYRGLACAACSTSKGDRLYLSEHYQVAVDKDVRHGFAGFLIWHLSIKRIDRQPIMDWRDLQAIKSAICGAEAEAVQLFPAESRVVDTSNQYHLWVFMKGKGARFPKLPLGWTTNMVADESKAGAVQRPRDVAKESVTWTSASVGGAVGPATPRRQPTPPQWRRMIERSTRWD